ncbi:PREDICTED: renalase-like isoform X2 [Priapulus caudatus]|uniref:Renalase-like isoform X2 n=1 Tax=Priapulus caudatus TaxID=37621 RepID=A0ABM1E8Q2_PRICU|nr:PREDICTED: renalase-like isoform X2 [Priapulus caudatus]
MPFLHKTKRDKKCMAAMSSNKCGRMSTSRSPANSSCIADVGAQYISPSSKYWKDHKRYIDELSSSGILEPLQATIEGDRSSRDDVSQHWVASLGIGSMVKYFFKKADAQVFTGCELSSLQLEGNAWQATTKDGANETFNAVVLTMPVPQILAVEGISKFVSEDQDRQLRAVQYSSRYALALFYDAKVTLDIPWAAKYFYDTPCIRFVSVDNVKRQAHSSIAPSIVVHTSVPFTMEHVDLSLSEVEPLIMSSLSELLPNLPTPASTKCHRWRYSQVHHGVEGSPGCFVLCEDPPLLAGGDAFVHSNLDGCIESARSISDALAAVMNAPGAPSCGADNKL